MKTIIKKIIKFILSLITAALVIGAIFLDGWWCNNTVGVTKISVETQKLPANFAPLRIAHISDIHDARFGEHNEKLLSKLQSCAPDIIVLTGDIIDSNRTDIGAAVDLVTEAVKIAPCFYVTGNHEAAIYSSFSTLEAGMRQAGVTVLRDTAVSLDIHAERITLIGLDDPGFTRVGIADRLGGLMPADGSFTILLSHRAEKFNEYVLSGVDLTFCGHAHGGQIRVPFVGGLFAPGQGYFPEYDAGLYTDGDSSMIVSRGLGNSTFPLRLNNRAEIVLTELSGKG